MYCSEKPELESTVEQFETASLDYLNSIEINNRQDTKYAFPDSEFVNVLEGVKDFYNILDIDGRKIFQYENLYYDTPELFMYFQHHNGKLNRYKMRYRKYIDKNTCFFEIKQKTNKLTTIKNRIESEKIEEKLTTQAKQFIKDVIGGFNRIRGNGNINIEYFQNLEPKLWVKYSRISLVHKERNEKVTFDTGLSFKGMVNGWSYLPGLVVAEIKQERFCPNSDFIKLMNRLKFREIRISKYTTGSILAYPDIKFNRFKPRLLFINKHCNNQNGYFKFL